LLSGATPRPVIASPPQENRPPSNPSIVGQWSPVVSLPAVPIHVHLLPNGSVLFWGGDGSTTQPATNTWLLDVNTLTTTQIVLPSTNAFCTGHSFLRDGRLLVTGGHLGIGHGQSHTNIFDFRTNTWTRSGNMNQGRWYPTNCTLANGDVLVVSGSYFNGTSVVNNTLPQVWNPTSGWRPLSAARKELALYPFMLLAPNGKVFNSGPNRPTLFLSTAGAGTWSAGPPSTFGLRDAGSSLMYDDGKAMLVGGGPPTNTAEVINLRLQNPSWRRVQSMAFARRHLNATIMADGKVLVTGGTSGPNNDAVNSVFAAEIWNPRTETWTTGASMQVRRLYHSTAILLPDGRVLVAGGGMPAGENLIPPDTDHPDMQIYSPPYLFKGPRPVISSSPASVGLGQTFFVRTPNHADIADVIWVRLSSVTHSYNQNQRINHLSFTPATQGVDAIGEEGEAEPDEAIAAPASEEALPATGLNITAPGSSNLCTPGHYMLFLINGNGVPSIARIIKVTPGSQTNAIEDSRFFVGQLHLDMLDREPDLAESQLHTRAITQCVNNGTCIQERRIERARDLWDSEEFAQKFPAVLNPAGKPRFDNREFVRLCFKLYLKRDPDPAGFDFWLGVLNQANDYNAVIGGILNLAEYRNRFVQ
jgi:hypothetical protein